MSTPRKPSTYTYDGIKRHLAGYSVKVLAYDGDRVQVKFLTGPGIHGGPIWVDENEIRVEE